MDKTACRLVLLTLIGLILAPAIANAERTITAYFPDVPSAGGPNSPASRRYMDSPGVGQFQFVYIVCEGFTGQFIDGAQYKVNYGPNFTFVQDIPYGGIVIGNSQNGISIGFGTNVKIGPTFRVQRAVLIWNSDCTTTGAVNASAPVVVAHPHFPDPTPMFTRFPSHQLIGADGGRAQICQRVELDITPSTCPNPFAAVNWSFINANRGQSGTLTAVLKGSSTVDVSTIDLSSLELEGVSPLNHPPIQLADIVVSDGDNDCICDDGSGSDGYLDIRMRFRNADIAAGIGANPPQHGTQVTLTLTGAYNDGMPFDATDCVVVVGQGGKKDDQQGVSSFSTTLGNPTPNPFNPVTWITYTVPTSQHVRLAIYDVAGRLVENLVDEVKTPGEHTVEWNAASRPSGVYFYRMETGSETIVRRATLLK